MSQLCKLAKGNKFSQSTSSFSSGPGVGDSSWTIKSMVTNVATGALFGLISLFGLSVLFGLPVLFGSSSVFATASSITITQSAASAHANIPPTAEGKFVATGTITFGVTTSHAAGYTASASATALSFVDTAGINGTVDATYTIAPLATGTAITAEQFAASTGTAYTNKWGYLPTTDDHDSTTAIVDNDKYLPAPIDTNQTLDTTATPNPSTANDYDITVGARVDHTLEQGQYTTTFTFAVVGNPTPYTITYNANAGGNTVTNMPDSIIAGQLDGETTTLAANYPYRDGYLFTGWCTTQVADNGTCTSPNTLYNPGATYTLDQTSTITTNTLNLYAVWDNCSGANSSSLLYCKVRAQVKKDSSGNELTQISDDLQVDITEPTSNNPLTDTSNSGVYKYDPEYFGVASDAANTMPIYYFRGILDQTYTDNDEYGNIPSTGDSGYYQNYIKLDNDTCWRIVRTTGSGGTKMIYNGAWTGSTCANAKVAASIASISFNKGTDDAPGDEKGTNGFIVYWGYRYNDDYGYNHTNLTTGIDADTLFGNSVNSNIKTRIESWYEDNMIDYISKMETSAGFCNDRTTYDGNGSRHEVSSIIPYDASGNVYVASGATNRLAYVASAVSAPSLSCLNPTGYDLLTVANGLAYPVALITADEAALAGSGWSNSTGYIHYGREVFLVSGKEFWTLSPGNRSTTGVVRVFTVTSAGYDRPNMVAYNYDARPVVSLASGTIVASGSGTASDPWVITP